MSHRPAVYVRRYTLRGSEAGKSERGIRMTLRRQSCFNTLYIQCIAPRKGGIPAVKQVGAFRGRPILSTLSRSNRTVYEYGTLSFYKENVELTDRNCAHTHGNGGKTYQI